MNKFSDKQIWSALHPTNSLRQTVLELAELGIILADVIPSAVCEDRIMTRGKNKGKRKLVYNGGYTLTAHDRDTLFLLMSGLNEQQYSRARFFVKNEKGQTMFSLVLGETTYPNDHPRYEYQQGWMKSFQNSKHLRHLLRVSDELDMTEYALL